MAGIVVESILRIMNIGEVMLTFHRLEVVACAEESLYFGVVVVVVRRLDLLWVSFFILNVMELIREASMGSM